MKNKYLSNHKENTLRHVEEVADTAVWLAKVYNLDIAKVKLVALLHDISAIMTPQEMYELVKVRGLEIDAAEEKYQFDNNLLLMPHQWITEAYEDLRNT